jgi:hypothetical protein
MERIDHSCLVALARAAKFHTPLQELTQQSVMTPSLPKTFPAQLTVAEGRQTRSTLFTIAEITAGETARPRFDSLIRDGIQEVNVLTLRCCSRYLPKLSSL